MAGLRLVLAGWATVVAAQTWPPIAGVLTNADQVRNLTAAQAAQAWPVHLTGVVIDESAPQEHAVMLADATAGIYLLAEKNLFAGCQRKDLLEIEGVTDPGQFAPIIKVRSVQKKGVAPIPEPRPVSYQDLITGALDGQWVEITGVIRSYIDAPKNGEVWRANIFANGGLVAVRCPGPRDPRITEDAEVRIQALCLYQFNQKRQALTPVLQVPVGVNLRVEKLAPENPFATPVRAVDSLLQFMPGNPNQHRIHVRGVVTYAQSGSAFWIRDASSGLCIQTKQADALKPGDTIEVAGFPAFTSFPPLLEDAIFRQTGHSQPPQPIVLTNASKAFAYENDLISLTALLQEVQPMIDGASLTLRTSDMTFKARLKNSPALNHPATWEPGGLVRVTGICAVTHDDVRPLMGIWQPQAFQILMRSADDLTILTRPPWWTPRHIIFLLGSVIGGLLLIMGGVTLFARRHLQEQNHQRALAEAEFSTILSERNRVAREIHDTLAQGLVATSVQLRLAKKSAGASAEPLQQYLDTAQQLVSDSLQEARNTIWNMRSQVLETGDLPSALKNILKQMAAGTTLITHFETSGTLRRLAPVIENNCLRVGQEAITNAVKHAQAKTLTVRLEYAEKFFRLRVTDDGCGFDPTQPQRNEAGFGLLGLRERAAEMKATLELHSTQNQGTEINLYVPLASD